MIFEGLRTRVRAWRNRIMARQAFLRWLAWFPLTRAIARRRAMEAFDLNAGFVYSQILAAAVGVGLLPALRDGPATPGELAPRLGLTEARTLVLLRACAALELVVPAGSGRFDLAMRGAVLLGTEGAIRMVTHHAVLYRDLLDPVALLRAPEPNTELRRFWSYGADDSNAASAAAYSSLMTGSVDMLTDDVLEAVPMARGTTLLDVGGGEGAFLEAVAARAPHLQVTLVDLPPVAARARARLSPLGDRVTVVGADARQDPLPRDQDVVTFVRIIHDHDDGPAQALLRAAFHALRPGGTVVIAEPMAGTPGAERMGDAYFGFYLLAMGQGRPRTADELARLVAAAGFERIRIRPTRRPLLARVLTAQRPRAA